MNRQNFIYLSHIHENEPRSKLQVQDKEEVKEFNQTSSRQSKTEEQLIDAFKIK